MSSDTTAILPIDDSFYGSHFFNRIPIGIYRLDREGRIVVANEPLARILGFSLAEELLGRRIDEFYVHQNDADEERRLIEERGECVNYKVELQKHESEPIVVSISAYALFDSGGGYAGREGTMVDVTAEERYRAMIEHVPLGLYEILRRDNEDIVTHCNPQFAAILGFDSTDEVIRGAGLRLNATDQEYAKFIQHLSLEDAHGQPLQGYSLRARRKDGKLIMLKVNAQYIRNRDGVIIGRIGAIRDVTNEMKLERRLEALTHDVGQTLHSYTSLLMRVRHDVDATIRSLGPDAFRTETGRSDAEIERVFKPQIQALIAAFDLLLDAFPPEIPGRTPLKIVSLLRRRAARLREIAEGIPIRSLPGTVRIIAAECRSEMRTSDLRNVSRQAQREFGRTAFETERLALLFQLQHLQEYILEMDHQVNMLRDYVTFDVRSAESPIVCSVANLLRKAQDIVRHYAIERDVMLEKPTVDAGVRIKCVEREMVRALANVYHNAVKYSWHRNVGRPPWVRTKVVVSDDAVLITIENRGVPITREEIEQGLVFESGYRGAHSGERGRVGTGIGLADAHRVALDHNGNLAITSEPIDQLRDSAEYDRPFLTTAAFTFPQFTGA